MGQTKPSVRRRGETRIQQRNRKEILDAAIDVIAEMGFDGARMEAISERSGLSRTNIHYYFRTRDELDQAVIKRVLDLWEDLWQSLDKNGSPREVLGRYISGKLLASWQQPKLSRIFAAEVFRGAPLLGKFIESEMRRTFEEACTTLRMWIQNGDLKSTNPEHVFFAIWGATQYYADFNLTVTLILRKAELTEADYNDASSTITNLILSGLMPDKD